MTILQVFGLMTNERDFFLSNNFFYNHLELLTEI